jgi:hypothetical protein
VGSGLRRALKPQPSEKKDLPKKKKTLHEVASEMKLEMLEKTRKEAFRKRAEQNRAEEEEVARMIFGPSFASGE